MSRLLTVELDFNRLADYILALEAVENIKGENPLPLGRDERPALMAVMADALQRVAAEIAEYMEMISPEQGLLSLRVADTASAISVRLMVEDAVRCEAIHSLRPDRPANISGQITLLKRLLAGLPGRINPN